MLAVDDPKDVTLGEKDLKGRSLVGSFVEHPIAANICAAWIAIANVYDDWLEGHVRLASHALHHHLEGLGNFFTGNLPALD